MPGEEKLRAILLKKARNQLDSIEEDGLIKYIGMLRGICDGIIEGGDKWEAVIAASNDTADRTTTEKEPSAT